MVIFPLDTVTLFNREYDVDMETETWLPTVLNNVNLQISKGANIEKNGLSDADSVRLFLDESSTSKKFLMPKEWGNLGALNKANYYTAASDESHPDFFVKGDLSELNIAGIDNLYEYMLKNYDDVYRVTTVDRYEKVMAHMEIGGK